MKLKIIFMTNLAALTTQRKSSCIQVKHIKGRHWILKWRATSFANEGCCGSKFKSSANRCTNINLECLAQRTTRITFQRFTSRCWGKSFRNLDQVPSVVKGGAAFASLPRVLYTSVLTLINKPFCESCSNKCHASIVNFISESSNSTDDYLTCFHRFRGQWNPLVVADWGQCLWGVFNLLSWPRRVEANILGWG